MKLFDDLKRLWPVLSVKRRRELFSLLILSLIGSVAELVTLGAIVPFVGLLANPAVATQSEYMQLFFQITKTDQDAFIVPISIAFVAIVVVATLIRLFLLWSSNRFVYGLGHDIGSMVFSDTLARPYSWHTQKNSSEIIGGLQKVQVTVQSYLLPLMNGSVALILALGIISMLVAIDPVMAILGAGAFGVFYTGIALSVRKRVRRNGKVIAKSNDLRIKQMQEALGGIRDVILDSAQKIYLERFVQVDSTLRRSQATNTFLSSYPRLAIEGLGMMIIAAFALLYSQTGDLSTLLPTLGALGLGAQKLLPLIQLIYIAWNATETNRASLHDVMALIETNKRTGQESRKIDFSDRIVFKEVSYSHVKNSSVPTLENINLAVKKGDCVGIVGKTGSGKSTFVDICMGLLRPDQGSICIDGTALNSELEFNGWQKHIAHVPQTIFLSDTTIAENIAFGTDGSGIDENRLKECAQLAEIHDYIIGLPDGFNTRVGERGVQLSGGQRQRIGIARALYKKADVLILDEATSALDSETEVKVINNLLSSSEKITMFMVAHRLTTLKNCNYIISLGKGEPLRFTTYEEIMDETNKEPPLN